MHRDESPTNHGDLSTSGTYDRSIELTDVLREETEDHSPGVTSQLDKATPLKLISAGFSFFVAGINDGSLGALIPWIIRDYGLNTAILSSV